MSEISIQIKLRSTGLLMPYPERAAYRMFIEGIADISENASIIGAKDDSEESEIRMTIKALIAQRLQIPHGKAFAWDKKQVGPDTEILTLFLEMIEDPHYSKVSVEQFVAWAREKHPEVPYKFATFERSMRRLRAGDKIETDGNGRYWLRTKKEIIA